MLHSSLIFSLAGYYLMPYWLDEDIDAEVLEISYCIDDDEDDIPFYLLNSIYDKGHWGL
jgi:hypothetical protein